VHAKDLGHFDLLLIDEAHLIPRSSDTMYGRFIAACRKRVPDMRIVGLTATPYRLDSGRLDAGEGAIFDRTIYSYGIADGVRDGHLAPLVNKATGSTINLEGLKLRAGEYIAEKVQERVLETDIIPAAVSEMVRRGQDRRGWLVFCCGVKNAAAVRDTMREHGISCEMVTGETPAAERDRIVTAYKRQEIRCLANVNVLTTGFNAPHVDLLAWLRPTLSTGLYIQGMGRGTRLAPGKADCLVLDFAGNIRKHGPVDMVNVRGDDADAGKASKDRGAPVKVCPECESFNHASATHCRDCGHEFPRVSKPKFDTQTDDSVPVLSTMPPQWVEASAIAAKVHNADREDKLPTLQVDYLCGMTWHKEWLCFDHQGFARKKAERAWSDMGGASPAPVSVEEAYQRRFELQAPSEILVKPDGRFWRVLARRMKQEAAA
jgi:DNA repair protein RadD